MLTDAPDLLPIFSSAVAFQSPCKNTFITDVSNLDTSVIKIL